MDAGCGGYSIWDALRASTQKSGPETSRAAIRSEQKAYFSSIAFIICAGTKAGVVIRRRTPVSF
jgi:hypothetical protein